MTLWCYLIHRFGWWSWTIDPLPYGSWFCQKCHEWRWPLWWAHEKRENEAKYR